MNKNYTLITGASSGIGKSFAQALAQTGTNLILIARREEALKIIASDLMTRFKVDIIVSKLDLTNSEERSEVLRPLFDQFEITQVINNAGVGFYKPFAACELREHTDTIELNINALVEVTYLALAHMSKHKKESKIINIASMAGFVSMDNYSIYCGTKHFVRSFTEALSIEYGQSNINFTCISPGGVATEFLDKAGQKLEARESLVLMQPDVLVEKSLRAINANRLHYTPGTLNQLTLLLMNLLPKQIGNKLATFAMKKATSSTYK